MSKSKEAVWNIKVPDTPQLWVGDGTSLLTAGSGCKVLQKLNKDTGVGNGSPTLCMESNS